MRTVVLKMHVSLDGYVRAASGDVMDWVFRTYDDELKAWEVDLLWQAGTHIMGRHLYEETHSRVSHGDVEEELARLKQESGKAILAHGGAEFAQSLSRLGFIDEYRLLVHPVVLAGGLPLFREPIDLKLLSTRSFPTGAVALIYGRI